MRENIKLINSVRVFVCVVYISMWCGVCRVWFGIFLLAQMETISFFSFLGVIVYCQTVKLNRRVVYLLCDFLLFIYCFE